MGGQRCCGLFTGLVCDGLEGRETIRRRERHGDAVVVKVVRLGIMIALAIDGWVIEVDVHGGLSGILSLERQGRGGYPRQSC